MENHINCGEANIKKLQSGTYGQPFSGCMGLDVTIQPYITETRYTGIIMVAGFIIAAAYMIMKKPK